MKKHKKQLQNYNSVQAINVDIQTLRENMSKLRPHAFQIAQLNEILETSNEKIRSQHRIHNKTRETMKMRTDRQTDRTN